MTPSVGAPFGAGSRVAVDCVSMALHWGLGEEMPVGMPGMRVSPAFLVKLADSCPEGEEGEFFDAAGADAQPGARELLELVPLVDDWNVGVLLRQVLFPTS